MPQFILTKQIIRDAFAHLGETENLEYRKKFLTEYLVPDVKWTLTGNAHSLAGTRYNVQDHDEATFKRLGKKLRSPIKFVVTRVILDAEPEADGWWCSVETRGEATALNGDPYDNEYVWLLRWNNEGKVVEIRSYFDTMLSEKILLAPE